MARNRGSYARFIQRLIASFGGVVNYDELINAAYPHPDHEPEAARLCLAQFLYRARRSGWVIHTYYGRGYRMA